MPEHTSSTGPVAAGRRASTGAAARVATLALIATLLPGCDEGGDQPKQEPRVIQDSIPGEYYSAPPPPPPPPPPPVVVQAPPAPPPAPEPLPPIPPAPPPPDNSDRIRAAQVAAILAERREAGPEIEGQLPDASVPPAKPRLQDQDYSRDETPHVDSGLPVDRRRILTQDRIINAVLVTPINSQLPGIVRAVVDSNVFGADDRLVLIPKGTVALGRYVPLNKQGETRLNVLWFRLIRPDGAHILNDEDPFFIAQDLVGHTGLIGDVDNRIFERYGAAMLTTLLSAISTAASSASDNALLNNTGTAVAQSLTQVTAKVLDQQINLAPIITIPAGSLITIAPTKDVFLRAPIYPADEDPEDTTQPEIKP